jgi:hypothetical protein
MSACDLIAAMADRGGRFLLTRKSKTPRASTRVAESRQHKNDNDHIFPAVINFARASA